MDIVIKPADKGSATVVMSKEMYMTEAHRELSDHRYYRKLSEDPTEVHASRVEELLEEMLDDKAIDKNTKEYLTPGNPKAARFYHQPKIHKMITPVPGRPIVSSCGAPTEHISEYVDYHLQPLVAKTPSYLKDTTDFLKKLDSLGPLPPDVNSLYTNIPHDEGMTEQALQTRPNPAPPTPYLVRMMEQILKLNNFVFDYLQVQGTAMGTRRAPSYANLFMADLEEKLLAWTTRSPHVWWRYIDDVFAIWEHGQQRLEEFLEEINNFHPTIKFTAECSTEKVTFLDTVVILEDGMIRTDLYTKPTDTH